MIDVAAVLIANKHSTNNKSSNEEALHQSRLFIRYIRYRCDFHGILCLLKGEKVWVVMDQKKSGTTFLLFMWYKQCRQQ